MVQQERVGGMSEKRDKIHPQRGLKDKRKKRYEPPYLRKREKLAEVTGNDDPVAAAPVFMS